MAQSSEEHNALLDQLQSQINLILEQTGRVFAALATNPKDRPFSQITKLRNSVPVATNRFHGVLDQLEGDLCLASTIIRRDLAMCREQAAIQPIPHAPQFQSHSQSTDHLLSEPDHFPVTQPSVDEPMQGTDSAPPESKPSQSDQDIDKVATPKPSAHVNSDAEAYHALAAADADYEVQPYTPTADVKSSIIAHTVSTTTEIKPITTTTTEGTLHVHTNATGTDEKTVAADDDDKAPDTANDLDSLFNDPTSAGGAETTNDFTFDQADTEGMVDFTTFGGSFDADNDNDNISSLLPGLEDYANPQPSASAAELDFNSLLDATGNIPNDAMNSQGAGEQRDTTFDDLMDLGNFDGSGMDGGGPDGDGGEAFDFDSLFS